MTRALGVVMAGGRGVRLGLAVPKALARFAEGTLLERAVAILAERCDPVVVVAPRALALEVPAPARVAHDRGAGPLDGLAVGLGAAPFEMAWVLGVDFPLVRRALFEALAARLEGSAALVAPRIEGRLQPLVAVYAPRALGDLEAALSRGARALMPVVEALAVVGIEAADLPGGSEALLNVNTPDDLAEAERRWRATAGAA